MANWTNVARGFRALGSQRSSDPAVVSAAMGVRLGPNQYGKAEVRLVAVDRTRPEHSFCDLNVSIALSGDLEAVHVTGDNTHVLTTDAQKNTVFAFAREAPVGAIEEFALRLGRHFAGADAAIARARVHVESARWERLVVDGTPHPHAFARADGELRTATAVCDTGGASWVLSGLRDLVVLKTTGSEFKGFLRDGYTTLAETDDRILATAVTACWRHATPPPDWDEAFNRARGAMLERFAVTHSRSLQQSLYAMAQGAIEAVPGIAEVRLSLPNRHHFLVDLAPFGLDNDGQVYHADDRPYGLIEAAILAEAAPPPGPSWDPHPLL